MFERYLEILTEKGLKNMDVSRATGIPASTFSDWKKGKSSPKLDKLEKIAKFFNVQVEYLTGASEYKTTEEMLRHFDDITNLPELQEQVVTSVNDVKQIPVRGWVAAGLPIWVQEEYIGYEWVDEDMAKRGNLFGLEIKGDSMLPRISEGDIVIVRQQDDAESGDIVIVSINGDHATCKRLKKYAEGISLISSNPAYEPITFTNKEIAENTVKIIGKVIENRQKY